MPPRQLARLLLATRALPHRAALFQARAMLRAQRLAPRGLPPRAALSRARAMRRPRRLGDDWALRSSPRPGDVAELLRLTQGRRRAVELGTAAGWTAGALLLAEPQRRLTSFDPV